MSEKIFDENKIKEISLLFGYFFELNYKLLKQSEDKKSEFTIENVFDFYISSHVISFLKKFIFRVFHFKRNLFKCKMYH